jgi:hypothetical protein
MRPILGGLGNVDQCRITDGPFFEGVSLRLFDLADSLWRIYWIDSTRVTDLKECFEGRQPRLGNQLVHVLSQAMNVTECLSRSIE